MPQPKTHKYNRSQRLIRAKNWMKKYDGKIPEENEENEEYKNEECEDFVKYTVDNEEDLPF